MFACRDCGRTAPADPDSGYDADDLCPDCEQAIADDLADELIEWAKGRRTELLDLDTLLDDDDYRYERWAEEHGED